MDTTCAVLITDSEKFLICHPTGAKYYKSWGLPKGCMDKNETYEHTAVREVFEETGIKLKAENLIFENIFPYHKDKQYCLFIYNMNILPDIKELTCSSTFGEYNKPEVDRFKYIGFDEIEEWVNPKQAFILKSVSLK